MRWAAGLALALLVVGCQAPACPGHRPFAFGRDTFSYANELVWEYAYDDAGKWRGTPREPRPGYTHHCFVVARAAKQFFLHARFDPRLPLADSGTYRRLVRRVVNANPRAEPSEQEQVVFPGYANLHDFSLAQAALLQEECGSFWESYFQRGHWRMLFPFSRGHQAQVANTVRARLDRQHPVVVHLVSFPSLTINHAVVLFGYQDTGASLQFTAYDPNDAEKPTVLTYDRSARRFVYPANDYYPGGPLNVYEVYSDALH